MNARRKLTIQGKGDKMIQKQISAYNANCWNTWQLNLTRSVLKPEFFTQGKRARKLCETSISEEIVKIVNYAKNLGTRTFNAGGPTLYTLLESRAKDVLHEVKG